MLKAIANSLLIMGRASWFIPIISQRFDCIANCSPESQVFVRPILSAFFCIRHHCHLSRSALREIAPPNILKLSLQTERFTTRVYSH
jgi:hypothetical protein